MADELPHSDREPDDLDAAASDHIDDPAASPTGQQPLASRIAAFEAVGAMVRDVPAVDDVTRRAQINAALDTIVTPSSSSGLAAPPPPANGTGTRRRQLVGLAAGIVLMAGTALGLSALAGTISPGEDSETVVADAADDPVDSMAAAEASAALDDTGTTPALGDFDTVEELVDAYRSTTERVEVPAPEAAIEADLESTAGGATDASDVTDRDVPAFEGRCEAGDAVATGLVTGRVVIVMTPAPNGDVTVVFLDDCSVVPVPSSP